MGAQVLSKTENMEQSLLARVRLFEEQALAEVYDLYSPGLYRYALRLLGEESLAEECLAETFSRFLSALRRGSGPGGHLQAYLYRVAHNWITDLYRRSPPPPLQLDESLSASEPTPGEELEQAQILSQVSCALTRLTLDQRQVIVLRYMEEMSSEEIAKTVGKPVGAVKSLQHRGLAALRRMLSGQEEEIQ